ncbi:hypothetical protein FE697_001255 [Mumia zhuanghuii]|uniref:Uncharacterized protein n=2 Tax=Mumia TaxID=1546255 RepID=A0ABW1QFM5_9ACTN|nr:MULTISPECIES: hypothetical protein [Mumia]KAA1424584.1 hypothetical protein FE697_001255 [Mumia zhuanghuii]
MPTSTLLLGVVLLVVIVGLAQLRSSMKRKVNARNAQRGAERGASRAHTWLGTGVVLETDPQTATGLVDAVAAKTMSKQVGPTRWALMTGFEEYAASAAFVRTPTGEVALGATTAPDQGGAPDGAAWLDFRDRVAKAAKKAGITARQVETGTFTPSTGPDGRTIWTSPAQPA